MRSILHWVMRFNPMNPMRFGTRLSSMAGRLDGWSIALVIAAALLLIGLVRMGMRTAGPPPDGPPARATSTPSFPSPNPKIANIDDHASPTEEPRRQAVASFPAIPPPTPLQSTPAQAAQPPSADNSAGIAAYEAGRYRDAIDHFEHARAERPDNPVIRHNLAAATAAVGWAAIESRDANDAIRQFRSAIEFDRTEASFYAGLAAGYQLRHESQRAVEALRAAVAIDPTRAELYEQLAELLYEHNQLQEAVAVLTMGIQRAHPPDHLSLLLARMTREQSLQGHFQQTGTRHFLIQFEGGENRDVAYQVLDLLELAYRDVGQALSFYPEEEIAVILYNNEQFRDMTQTPSWTKGIYDGKIRLPVGGSAPDRHLLAKVLYHEYTHVIVHELSADHAPTWLNEGLAVYCEGLASGNLEGYQEALKRPSGHLPRERLLPLSALHGSFLGYTNEQAALAYAESFDATRYLVDHYGLFRMKELLQLLGTNRPFDRAFEDAFFLSYPEFERLWQETVAS